MNTQVFLRHLVVLAAFGLCSRASAQTFTYANSSTEYTQNQSESINLSAAGNTDYVFYTYGGETQTDGASYITGGTSNFNPVLTFGSDTNSSGVSQNDLGVYNGPNAKFFTPHTVTYTGGYQYSYTSSGSVTANGNTGDNNNGGTETLGFASVTPQSSVATTQSISSSILLDAAAETFSFYIEDNSAAADFTFKLYNTSNQLVATSTDTNIVPITSDGDLYGSFTLSLAGAAAGDTLDWIETPDLTDYTDNGYVQVGIEGIAVTPEPATYAYLAFGLVALAAMVRCRKQSV